MKLFSLLLALALGACSAENDLAKAGNAELADTGRGEDDTGDADETDTAVEDVPAWYVVRAQLAVVEGVASAEGAVVSIDVIDADLERIDCVVELQTGLVTAGALDADLGIVWWDVPVRASAAPCAPLPETLSLGVGTLHPDARARLGTVGHDDIAASLYGAWLRADGAEASAYGYAGTAGDLAGDDLATLPPPDGLYQLAPLYVVALP